MQQGKATWQLDAQRERPSNIPIRQSEHTAQLHSTQLRTLMDLLPALVWLKDTDNRILRINKRVAEAAGMSVEAVEGRPSSEIYPQEAAGYFADDLEVIRSGAARLGIVEKLVDGSGTERWLETDKAPVRNAAGTVVGICVMAHDVTQREQAANALLESERRFSDLLNNVELVAVMLDRAGRITYCNDHFLSTSGWKLEEVLGQDWFTLFMPLPVGDMRPVFEALLQNSPEAWHRENEIFIRSGERRLIRWSNSVLRSADGKVVGTASIGEDITEQRAAETRIKRLNRVYAVLSGINSLIVRVRDRDELFKEACEIAVSQGRFKMAWIGLVDAAADRIVPMAAEGADADFLALIEGRANSRAPIVLSGNTVTAQVLKYKKAIVTNNIAGDTTMIGALERLDRGIASMAILPLMVAGEANGVLALYSEEPNFFDDEEMKLLTNLAGDIGFAIDHIEKNERLDYLAYYDELTGLANRRLFMERVASFTRSASTNRNRVTLCLIDLQNFKNINDTLGRPAGDQILCQVSSWLAQNVSDTTLLARVGADHFAVVMPDLNTDTEALRKIEQSMRRFVEHPFTVGDAVFHISAHVGVASSTDGGSDADTLFTNAEIALRRAKSTGTRCMLFHHEMTNAASGKLTLENKLRQALRNDEFVLFYQPKVSCRTGTLTGVEALMRWNDPASGLISPAQFIPVLEETGLILEVGEWALHQAMRDHRAWRRSGHPAVRIAVNVSPLQLRQPDFISLLSSALGDDAPANEMLELEITESLVMEDIARCTASLSAIRAMGITIAIDDFGTGFSSLSYLAKLPIDTLKIDGSFVADMTSGPKGLALVSTIIGLGHALQLRVIAEGVETASQSHLLRLLKCDEMQGYLHSRPMPAAQLEATYLASAGTGIST